jgi:hypothetical protein
MLHWLQLIVGYRRANSPRKVKAASPLLYHSIELIASENVPSNYVF